MKGDFCPMERIFDTHAHYFDKKFESIEGGADAVLCDVFANGVAGIVNVGTNLQNAQAVIEQASRYEKMYAARMRQSFAVLNKLNGEVVDYASCDTWQFTDYSKFQTAMFNEEHKRKMREE